VATLAKEAFMSKKTELGYVAESAAGFDYPNVYKIFARTRAILDKIVETMGSPADVQFYEAAIEICQDTTACRSGCPWDDHDPKSLIAMVHGKHRLEPIAVECGYQEAVEHVASHYLVHHRQKWGMWLACGQIVPRKQQGRSHV
jgi:hypothetical protein